jgi:N2227-like protein
MYDSFTIKGGILSWSSSFVMTVIMTIGCAFSLLFASHLWIPWRKPAVGKSATPEVRNPCKIPFIDVSSESSNAAILASMSQFRTEAYQAIQGLSAALEKATELESKYTSTSLPENVRLSKGLLARIEQASKCLDEQELVLQRLLMDPGFSPILALPDTTIFSSAADLSRYNDPSRTMNAQASPTLIRIPPFAEKAAYDSSTQIIAHIVRDWTALGIQVRQSLYGWCVQQVKHYHRAVHSVILVPGAGLGRLAFDLACQGYTVEANELSPVMAAAAQAILHWHIEGQIYPYLLDRMANEVNASERFLAVSFPDIDLISLSRRLALSFTIGDFVGPYYQARSNSFGAVVTCFFLDTATNLYEYLDLIVSLLEPGGVWINVGPLQWHGNAMLVPAADELRLLISSRFRILSWSIDTKSIAYRDTERDTTNYEGYRPLRFVALRK